jgi:DNA-binding MarR family transcriptional regulator
MGLEDEIKQKKFDSEYHKLVLNLVYTYNWIEQPMKALISKYNITTPQYNILRILKGSFPKPLSPQDIKAVMLHKKSDLTRMLDRLVSKDLIDRKICPSNRRKMDIVIREEGIELLNKLNPELRAITDDQIADHISEKEAKIANDLIDKLRG